MRTVIRMRPPPAEAVEAMPMLLAGEFGHGSVTPSSVVADSSCKLTIEYVAGRRGLPSGAGISVAVPMHGWSLPTLERGKDGFVEAETDAAAALELELSREVAGKRSPHVNGWILVKVAKGALKEGERLFIYYGGKGDGAPGAEAQNQPQRKVHFVMCYGLDPLPSFMKGVEHSDFPGCTVFKGRLEDGPAIEVLPGPAERLECVLPSVSKPGGLVKLRLLLLDRCMNPAASSGDMLVADLRWSDGAPVTDLYGKPLGRLALEDAFPISRAIEAKAPMAEGFFYLAASWRGGRFTSNPMEVSSSAEDGIFWGELHGQGAQSDGFGEPDEYFERARKWFCMDVAALTDHSDGICWPAMMWEQWPRENKWDRLCDVAKRANADGEFVAFPAMELSSDVKHYPSGIRERNHRNAYFMDEEGSVCFNWREFPDTQDWYRLLPASNSMIIPHTHKAKLDCWHHDPFRERVIETFSDKGPGEFHCIEGESPTVHHGGFLQFLKCGYRVGFVGGGDYHCDIPGRHFPAKTKEGYREQTCQGGYAAIAASQLSRKGIWSAIRSRKTYATTGVRAILRFKMSHAGAATGMGEEKVTSSDNANERVFSVKFALSAPLKEAVLVRQGVPFASYRPDAPAPLSLEASVSQDLMAGELLFKDADPLEALWLDAKFPPMPPHKFVYYYAKLIQADGNMAWTSPIWLSTHDVMGTIDRAFEDANACNKD